MSPMRLCILIAVFAALSVSAAESAAHSFAPISIQLSESPDGDVSLRVRAPASNAAWPRLMPALPAFCDETQPAASQLAETERITTARFSCSKPLIGHELRLSSDEIARRHVVLVARLANGAEFQRILPRGDSGFLLAAEPGEYGARGTPGVLSYVWIGVEHIWFGFDHLLFVLCLVLLIRERTRLLWTITAFTLAHSITLGLAAMDVVQVPGPPVEATIALSIVLLAVEAIRHESGIESLTSRMPWLVALLFGLIHGLGFAGALSDIGLPPNQEIAALACFNLGVELGQLAFVAVLVGLGALAGRFGRTWKSARLASAWASGCIASYWLVERVAGFYGL